MPLGICNPCERAYIYGAPEGAPAHSCPRCGQGLALTPIRHMTDLPQLPLRLLEQSRQNSQRIAA